MDRRGATMLLLQVTADHGSAGSTILGPVLALYENNVKQPYTSIVKKEGEHGKPWDK
jgi:hypothetical protein